jgi:hypothetical protein
MSHTDLLYSIARALTFLFYLFCVQAQLEQTARAEMACLQEKSVLEESMATNSKKKKVSLYSEFI